jgi:hypothetical protein
MAAIDVNKLREAIRQNQNLHTALPSDPSRQVVVDKNGNVLMGSQVQPGQLVTQVPQETFA